MSVKSKLSRFSPALAYDDGQPIAVMAKDNGWGEWCSVVTANAMLDAQSERLTRLLDAIFSSSMYYSDAPEVFDIANEFRPTQPTTKK